MDRIHKSLQSYALKQNMDFPLMMLSDKSLLMFSGFNVRLHANFPRLKLKQLNMMLQINTDFIVCSC